MIPPEFVETLLARVDIVEVIGKRIKLKKSGVNYFACCPFHGEKTPSFSVSPSKQFYHCFGCGAHGTAITFLMAYEGLTFPAAVEALAHEVGLTVPKSHASDPQAAEAAKNEREQLLHLLKKAAHFYQQQLHRSPEALNYLTARGIGHDAIHHFGLGYAPEEWQALAAIFPHYNDPLLEKAGLVIDHESGRRYDRFRHRILFPIHNRRGEIVAFGGRVLDQSEPKYLNSPETPLFSKSHELYALALARDAIRRRGHVIVVEGYMDVVALWQHGIDNAVAVLGTAATPHHVKTLLTLTDEIIFCFDGDDAGRRAAWRALEQSLEALNDGAILRFAFLPEGEDPDSFVRTYGADRLREALERSQTLSQYLIDSLVEGLPLDTPEGRARLVHLAQPLLSRIAAPQLKRQIEEELAQRAKIPADHWLQAPQAARTPPPTPPVTSRPRNSFTRRRPVATLGTRLLRLLLAHPTLAARVSANSLLHDDDPDLRAALRLIDAIEHGELSPHAPLAAITAHFQADEALFQHLQSHVAALIAEPPLYDEDPEAELAGILEGFTLHALQQEIAELMAKARSQPLHPNEQHRLQTLIRESKRRRSFPDQG
ncbi:hypothetical protein JCM16106_04040 [Hydrogenophilus islandicus]